MTNENTTDKKHDKVADKLAENKFGTVIDQAKAQTN